MFIPKLFRKNPLCLDIGQVEDFTSSSALIDNRCDCVIDDVIAEDIREELFG